MVPPYRFVAKVMTLLPPAAFALLIASHSEPEPESFKFVTAKLASNVRSSSGSSPGRLRRRALAFRIDRLAGEEFRPFAPNDSRF
jgi:hypothetical protein